MLTDPGAFLRVRIAVHCMHSSVGIIGHGSLPSILGKKGKGGGRVRCIGMEENANRRWCSTYEFTRPSTTVGAPYAPWKLIGT